MLAKDMKRLELEKPQPAKDASNGGPKLKSTAPTGNPTGYGARPGSLHRVFLMRDVRYNESVKYGFAEFWTLEDATAAMTKFNVASSFTVGAVPVTISNIHLGVFLPETRDVPPESDYKSFYPLLNPNMRVRYRDTRLYPSVQVITSEPPAETNEKPPTKDDNDSKKSKKRKAEGPAGAATTKKAPVMDHLARWQRKADELRGQDGSSNNTKSSDNPKSGTDGPMKFSLSGTKIGGASPSAGPDHTPSPDKASATEPAETAISYVDRQRLMCLLCMRKYKSVEEVNIHERSRSHKTQMENEEAVKLARGRIQRVQKQPPQPEPQPPADPSSDSQYRDRAMERRQTYSQPKKAPASNPVEQPAPPPPPKPKESKGAALLSKMGWKEGAGLGAEGQGRTEVIAQNAYQEGAGLGSEGGILGDAAEVAQRKTTGTYKEYVNSVQDRARERYQKMG